MKIGFSFEEWAGQEEVKAAWRTIQEVKGLKNVFGTLDADLLGSWSR